jgi:positive regulator of sigma E activity
MNESQQDNEQKDSLRREIRLYVEKRIQLVSVAISEQISLMIAQSFQKLAGVLLLSSAVLFLWLALSFFLGDLLNNTSIGFLIASFPLFIFGFIFMRQSSKKITDRIQAQLISRLMDGFEESFKIEKLNQEEDSSGKE